MQIHSSLNICLGMVEKQELFCIKLIPELLRAGSYKLKQPPMCRKISLTRPLEFGCHALPITIVPEHIWKVKSIMLH